MNSNDDTGNQAFGLLINEVEVIFEDDLGIEDILQEEVILSVDETDLNQPGTNHQDVLREGDQPVPIIDCSLYLKDKEKTATNIDNSIDYISNDEEPDDPNDPDFVFSDDEIMQISLENDSNIGLNKNGI